MSEYANQLEKAIMDTILRDHTADEMMAHYLSCVFVALRLEGDQRREWLRRGEIIYRRVQELDKQEAGR